ncbi:MAG: hypothetical protein ABIJ15_01110 [bacterium]
MKKAAVRNDNTADFKAALRRSLKQRLQFSFIRTYKPVIDDGPGLRSFDKLSDYKKWSEKLPAFLGYGKKI